MISKREDVIGVGFIGAGKVAGCHKAALLKIPGVRLAAVYDRDRAQSEKLASPAGARVCSDVEELLGDPAVEVVYILTPQASHYEYALQTLRAGKTTFIEKPVTLRRSELEEIIELSAKSGCLCVPGHNYIHDPALRSIRGLVDSGQLGEICSLWILFTLFLPDEICRSVSGVLREVMVHHFYSLLYLWGKPESVLAAGSDLRGFGLEQAEQAVVVCRMPGGGLATLFASFSADDLTADPWTVRYKVLGTGGSASHSWNSVRLRESPYPLWDLPGYRQTFEEEDRYFIEECVRQGGKPLSDLGDALTCLDILEAAERSAATGTLQRL